VQRVELADPVPGEQSRVVDLLGAADVLLGGLEQEHEVVTPRPGADPLEDAQADSHVHVVAAGVHRAGARRGERQAGGFGDGQGVHVRPPADCRPAGAARGQVHDDPGAIPRDLRIGAAIQEPGDRLEELLARLVLFEGELGNPVQLPPDLDQVKHQRDPPSGRLCGRL
jgi:hypothetical protein